MTAERAPVPSTVAAPAPQPDALAALRLATHERHAWLDSHLPLSRADASMADYQRHLRMLAGWLEALSPWLVRAGVHVGADGGYLRLAQSDLADAAMPGMEQARPVPAGAVAAPRGADAPGFGWGVAYVVEGSQLGGQVLHRRLATALAPHPLRYLRGRGDQTGAHWKHFVQRMRGALATPADVEAACAGAVWAFDLMIQTQK